jgi:capsular exopolysaccharide synthesis family protein
MAQAGLKVTLIDCDLRRPVIYKQFEVQNRTGLTDIMLQDTSLWNGVAQPTGVNNLSVVLSGSLPPNPSELLGSKRMHQFISHLQKSSDIIIIDAPPLLPVTDALVLSSMTDGVLLVIDNGTTRIGEVVQGKTQLDQAGARILGVVMNKIPTGRRGYSYYYYYYHRYYDYDGDGKGRRRHSQRGGQPAATPMPAAPMADAIVPRDSQLNPSQK